MIKIFKKYPYGESNRINHQRTKSQIELVIKLLTEIEKERKH